MAEMKRCPQCGAPNPKYRVTCYNCNTALPDVTPAIMAPEQIKTTKTIVETRCTCLSCGHIWHYGAEEINKNLANAGTNLGNACTFPCCCCTSFMPERPVTDLKKCPKCGSRATESEQIEHDVSC